MLVLLLFNGRISNGFATKLSSIDSSPDDDANGICSSYSQNETTKNP